MAPASGGERKTIRFIGKKVLGKQKRGGRSQKKNTKKKKKNTTPKRNSLGENVGKEKRTIKLDFWRNSKKLEENFSGRHPRASAQTMANGKAGRTFLLICLWKKGEVGPIWNSLQGFSGPNAHRGEVNDHAENKQKS